MTPVRRSPERRSPRLLTGRTRLAALCVAVVAAVAFAPLTGCTDDNESQHRGTTTTVAGRSKGGTVTQQLTNQPGLGTTARLVTVAGLGDTLGGRGPLTFFAPDDEAWKVAGKDRVQELTDSPEEARALLEKLVVRSRLTAADLVRAAGKQLDTLGGKVPVEVEGRTLTVDGAPVARTDQMTTNGIIHVLSAVPDQ